MKPFAGSHRFSASHRGLAHRTFGLLAVVAVIASSTLAFAQAGHLDSTYGTGGVFTTHFTQTDSTMANAVAIQSDGKVVVGGSTPGGARPGATQHQRNARFRFRLGRHREQQLWYYSRRCTAVAIQPDGQIVAAAVGDFFLEGSVGRFNPDGSVDTTFGNSGFAISRSIDSGAGILSLIALQADGKILVTGGSLIGRYTATGQLDTTFGNAGIAPLTSADRNRNRAAIGRQDPGNHRCGSADNPRRIAILAIPTSGCDFTLQHQR